MKKIELTQGKFALVDNEDFKDLSQFKWFFMKQGYASRNDNSIRKQVPMHRYLMGLSVGQKLDVDHINGDRLDNRRCNLRVCTRSENLMNRGKTCANTSGYKGVTWDKSHKKWKAQITKKGINYHLGLFHNAEDASTAYQNAAKNFHGNFSK